MLLSGMPPDMNTTASPQRSDADGTLPFDSLSPDNPLRRCTEEINALYYLVVCRYENEKELSDRRIVLHHLKRLMVAMCAPTLRETFDENNVFLNPQTERYMQEVERMFDAIVTKEVESGE